MPPLIKMEVTDSEATLFLEFKRYYVFMKLLESMGAFEMRNGSLTLNFDQYGEILSVDKQQHFRV